MNALYRFFKILSETFITRLIVEIVEMSLCSVERDLKMGHGDLCVSRHFELGSIERIPQVSLDCAH